MASGLQTNLTKTKVFYLGHSKDRANEITEKLGCKKGTFSINYLRIPISNMVLPRKVWEDIIT